MEEDTETKIYNLLRCADNNSVFILINPYEVDILFKNRIRINKIDLHYYDSYNNYYSYGDIVCFYKKKYATAAENPPNIYLLGGGIYYGGVELAENIHIENKFNCLKYLSKYNSEIVIGDQDDGDNAQFVRLLKKNYMNSLFYSTDNTGILGIEGYFPFYDKFYSYLDTIDNIYIINSYNDDFCQFVEKNHKHKVKHLKLNIGRLFYTNPELIAYYRSRTDFNHNNYLHSYYNFDRRFTIINDNIIIGNDTYKYINYYMKRNNGENWFPDDVTHIMNVSDDVIEPEKIPYSNIVYEYYPIDEREKDTNITKNKLLSAVDRLHELIEANNKVFIHCSVGMNRSPAVVLMYLIKYRGMTLFGAYNLICTKRFIYTSYELFDIIYNEAISIVVAEPKKSVFSFWSNLQNKVISPLKLRTNYAYNFSQNGAHMFSLYDIIEIRRLARPT